MVEFLKLLAEALLKWLSPGTLRETVRQKRLREIGVELFLLYSSLNELYVRALAITDEIEVGLRHLGRKAAAGETGTVHYTSLRQLLTEQKIAISRLCRSVESLRFELQVLSPEVYAVLGAFLQSKGGVVIDLQRSLFSAWNESKGLVDALVSIPEQAIVEAAREALVDASSFSDGMSPIVRSLRRGRYPPGVKVTDLDEWSQDTLEILAAFMATAPRQRLEVLRHCLVQLRSALEKTFSIQDILLEVGDRRAS